MVKVNYQELLISNNYNKNYVANDVYDWDTFIFDPPSDKPSQTTINQWINDIPLKACKQEAKRLIQSSDWSVLPDVSLQNKSDFEAYRKELRELILNPVEEPTWPTEPKGVWK